MVLEKGAAVDAKDEAGRTPLMNAAGHVFPGTAGTVTLLLEKGADPNARAKDGRTPLADAKQYGPPEVVELLQKAGAR